MNQAAKNLNQEIDRAVALHRAGRIAEARTKYIHLLQQYPRQPDVLRLLGTAEHQLGHVEEAVKLLEQSLQLDPDQPDAHNNCGNALRDLERYEEALAHFDRAIALLPDYPDAYCNRGNTLRALRRFDAALQDYDQALTLNPNIAQVHNNRGNTLRDLNRPQEALESFNRAIALNPDYAEAYNNRGNLMRDLGKTEAAMEDYNYAIAVNTRRMQAEDAATAELYNNRGNALRDLQQYEAALTHYDKALALKPDYAEAHTHRGIVLSDLGRFAEALESHDRAIALQPDYAEAYSNRGNSLRGLNRLQEALESLNHAIELAPENARAYTNRGNVLSSLGQIKEATNDYNRALELTQTTPQPVTDSAADELIMLAPEFADGYWNKAVVKLLNGEFEEGWKLYEWRWKTKQFISKHQQRPGQLWLGQVPLAGKTILVYPEQGLGDFIQFVRYVKLLEAMGAQVMLEVPLPLVDIVSSMEGNFFILPAGTNPSMLPDYDLQCPIMSLPHAFGTTLANVPAAIPYLYADAEKQAEWAQKLGTSTGKRIGLVWSGTAQHINDHNRSIPFEKITALLNAPYAMHCLQKEFRSADAAQLAHYPHLKLHADALHDFSDTAALIANLDLVISVDTSVAHMAAAMGKTTWLLLPYAPDYRWLLQREDTPWYPNMKLWRQPQPGDWASVLHNVREALEQV